MSANIQDGFITGGSIAARDINATVQIRPTGRLRWLEDTLQQELQTTTFGIEGGVVLEWRDVPTVEND